MGKEYLTGSDAALVFSLMCFAGRAYVETAAEYFVFAKHNVRTGQFCLLARSSRFLLHAHQTAPGMQLSVGVFKFSYKLEY